ncbi:hypothetical protein [Bacillus wiedmannii]|uniref:RiboL-PSP-HEPN domain-containing protein n=1 Tax=Bacillus wiedmannii TaxID=1890302 RepID=A0ABD6TKT8_9BACI|nr:hypothetical protein [Bacillus wiedmannii]PEO58306.1 hypothetical protein CN560_12235 [Bacillus wiedmannii]PGC75956.1 hypothetical protein COM25_10060 [Bacillus wiedmannii]PHG19447.1 hypothetical protein COI74_17930 [Bacillus wiedmannii]
MDTPKSVLNHPICKKFYERILEEFVVPFDLKGPIVDEYLKGITKIDSLKVSLDKPDAKNLYEIFSKSDSAEIKMKIVYLSNLMEAFMKEYIANKEGKKFSEVKNVINDAIKNDYKNPHNESILHIDYCIVIMDSYYSKDLRKLVGYDERPIGVFDETKGDINKLISPLFLELGKFRHLLVHYDGNLENIETDQRKKEFEQYLKATIEIQGQENGMIFIDSILLDEYITSALNFIWECAI